MKAKLRPFTLMEVLVAMALISLCAIPLLYPHYSILKEEKIAVRELEWDRLAGVVYGQVLRDLYNERISWDEIQQGTELPVESELLQAKKLQVTRRVSIDKAKPQEQPTEYILRVDLNFAGKKNYAYYLYAERPAPQLVQEES